MSKEGWSLYHQAIDSLSQIETAAASEDWDKCEVAHASAARCFKQALVEASNDPDLWVRLAEAWEFYERDVYDRGLEIQPRNGRILFHKGRWLYLHGFNSSYGRPPEDPDKLRLAIVCLDQALSLQPRDVSVLIYLSRTHGEFGEFDKAYEYLRKAQDLAPHDYKVRDAQERVEKCHEVRDPERLDRIEGDEDVNFISPTNQKT